MLGRLTAVPGYAHSITYHYNGMLDEIEYPNEVGYFQDRDPHGMRRPGSIGLTFQGALVEPELYLAPGAVTHNLTYEYDGAGNIKKLGPERYQYDAVSRVVRGTLGSDSYQQYTFDRFGNIGTIFTLRDTGTETQSETRAYAIDPATNRLLSAAYDADGNQLTYGAGGLGFTYTWDPLSKMKSSRRNNGSQNEFYVYTADDERLYVFDNSVSPAEETWTLRDLDGKVLRTWGNVGGSGGTWSHEKDHIYRDGQLLASWSPTDGPRYYHLDHLGTPRLTTNQFGRHADSAAYFPFGEQAGLEEPSDERMRFTGHERDQHGPGQLDDLDYMHQRYCNPMTGRFLSVDPVARRQALRRPQFLNRYSYVGNNPLGFTDPNGLCAAPAGLSEGQVGICIEAFIMAPRVGGIGLGDDRGFAANDSNATARISLMMRVDPKAGKILQESILPGRSKVGFSKGFSTGLEGTARLMGGSVQAEDGLQLSLFISGENGFEGVANLGSIEVYANLLIAPDGTVQVLRGSATKEFPSVEGFAYTISNGELVIQQLFTAKETEADALKRQRFRSLQNSCSQALYLPSCR